jgi:DNA-binding NarL/FixJ family response regulator
MSKTKIVIVDDHRVVVEGIKSTLSGYPEFEVIGEAFTGRQAVREVKRLKPDIVIMDISMPELNGIEATVEIRKFDPHVKVVVFTMYSQKEYIINLFKIGISAYILKGGSLSELIIGIKAVAHGGTYLSEAPSRTLIELMKDLEEGKRAMSNRHGIESLSIREQEVLRRLADGETIKEIARQLFISPKTVESHKYNMMEKLGVRTTAGLVKIAIKNKLVEI